MSCDWCYLNNSLLKYSSEDVCRNYLTVSIMIVQTMCYILLFGLFIGWILKSEQCSVCIWYLCVTFSLLTVFWISHCSSMEKSVIDYCFSWMQIVSHKRNCCWYVLGYFFITSLCFDYDLVGIINQHITGRLPSTWFRQKGERNSSNYVLMIL